jgi:tetratricopeptide (TPR) repeat protein
MWRMIGCSSSLRHSAFVALVLVAFWSGSQAHAGSAAEAFAAAETQYREGAYEQALTSYRDFSTQFPDDWRAAQARFTAAFILQKKLSRPVQAREAYESVVKHNAGTPLATTAEYHIAEAYEQAGDTQQAIKEYTKFLKRANRHARAPDAGRKVEFLDRKAQGLDSEPPGWADKLERKQWRKHQPPPGEAGEKRPHGKGGPGRNGKPKNAERENTGDVPTPPPLPAQPDAPAEEQKP